MTTPNPNNPNPQKKPAQPGQTPQKPASAAQPGQTPQKPAGTPQPKPAAGQKPAAPGAKPAGGAPAKPPASGAKPPAAGNGAAAAKQPPKPGAKKPAAKEEKKPKWMPADGTRKLGQVLIDLGFLDEAQVEQLYEDVRATDSTLERVVIDSGLLTEDQLLQAVAEQHGLRVINLDEVKPQPEAVKMVQETMATLYKMLPLSYENDILNVVMADPNNLQALDDIRNFLGIMKVEACLAPVKMIEAAILQAYQGKQEESISDLIASLEADATLGKVRRETSIDLEELEELTNAAPVRKLINMVLLMAIRDHASDIHFEPFEDEYKMRYRCDGVLYEMVPDRKSTR